MRGAICLRVPNSVRSEGTVRIWQVINECGEILAWAQCPTGFLGGCSQPFLLPRESAVHSLLHAKVPTLATLLVRRSFPRRT